MVETVAAVGLGSNLGEPEQQVGSALSELDALPRSSLLAASRLYRSAPMGPQDQPPYVNAAALVATRLEPLEFLHALQELERRHGRERRIHWGARTLDLDLLLWGDQVIDHARLQVPHPGLHLRAFVLYPLAEIAADLEVPGRGGVQALRDACPAEGLLGVVEPASTVRVSK